jgi:hypothetical protein
LSLPLVVVVDVVVVEVDVVVPQFTEVKLPWRPIATNSTVEFPVLFT